ncbi:MAG: hypothetical protein V1742_04345, partial [Pseudomonadota bacterium]
DTSIYQRAAQTGVFKRSAELVRLRSHRACSVVVHFEVKDYCFYTKLHSKKYLPGNKETDT